MHDFLSQQFRKESPKQRSQRVCVYFESGCTSTQANIYFLSPTINLVTLKCPKEDANLITPYKISEVLQVHLTFKMMALNRGSLQLFPLT